MHKKTRFSCSASHLRSRISEVGIVARLDGTAGFPVGPRDFLYSETSKTGSGANTEGTYTAAVRRCLHNVDRENFAFTSDL